ncbi:hypothetical protein D3C87_2006360 [compost metagenome]
MAWARSSADAELILTCVPSSSEALTVAFALVCADADVVVESAADEVAWVFATGVAAKALKLIPAVAIARVIKSALIPRFMLFSPCLLTAR